jgi:ubiquinone/menaquinone biosynthesis C-methylase UbiE
MKAQRERSRTVCDPTANAPITESTRRQFSMYKELRTVASASEAGKGEHSTVFEGIRVSTPESWARNFASSKKLSFFKKLKIQIDRRYKLVRKYIKPGGKILDAGCGFGEWVSYLNGKTFVATGLDYSETLITRLRQTYPTTGWIYGPVEKIPAEDRTFDGIISWGVIEHNEEGPQAAISEFYRILKPGGCAIVTVPFEDELAVTTSKLDWETNAGPGLRAFYCYYMTEKDLCNHMREGGFDVVEVGACPPATLGKVLPRVYMGLNRYPRLRQLLIYAFGAAFFWKTDWYLMRYAVGIKQE